MSAALSWLSWALSTAADILGAAFAVLVLLLMAGLVWRAMWEDIFRPLWLDLVFYVSTQARNIRRRFSRKDNDQ